MTKRNSRLKRSGGKSLKLAALKPKLKSAAIALSLVAGLAGLAVFSAQVRAASHSAGPLELSYGWDGPIFSETALAPGSANGKTVKVKNNGTVSHSFAIATKNVSGELKDKLYLKPEVGGSEVWSKTIEDLLEPATVANVVIPDIAPGAEVEVALRYALDSAIGNEYMDKNVSFDLVFGTGEEEPIVEPTPTPSPTPAPSPTPVTTPTETPVSVPPLGEEIAPAAAPTAPTAPITLAAAALAPALAAPEEAVEPEDEEKDEEEGLVKGAEDEEEDEDDRVGKNWLLLLIPPIAAALALMIPTIGLLAGVGVPIAAGVLALILSYYFAGNMSSLVFWIILIVEVIIIVLLNYILLSKEQHATEKVEVKARKKR